MSGRTKNIEGWLVVDWKKESLRARKTEPTTSELGTNELVGEIGVSIEIPDIPVPEASAEFEVPEPMVENALLEALDDRAFTDWQKTAESIIADLIDLIEGAPDENLDNIRDGITVETLRETRGRPSIDEVGNYVEDSVREIRLNAESD